MNDPLVWGKNRRCRSMAAGNIKEEGWMALANINQSAQFCAAADFCAIVIQSQYWKKN
jgi:hypothetical protein